MRLTAWPLVLCSSHSSCAPRQLLACLLVLAGVRDNDNDDNDNGAGATTALEFSVEDNGPGIPTEDHASVFKPFFKRRHTSQQGSGLNLSIAEQIVKLHGACSCSCVCASMARAVCR